MRPRSRSAGLLVQQVGDQTVAYDQVRQRLHVLNRTTAATWRHCDGRNTVADIVALVARELEIPADDALITLALEQLDEAHLLEERLAPDRGTGAVSRREVLHWAAAAAAGLFLPAITSCGSPLAPDGSPGVPTGPRMTLGVETTTSTTPFSGTTTSTSTTPFSTTTSTSSTTTPFVTTTSTTSTTPFVTTTSTTSTTPFVTTTSTTSTTPFVTTTSTTPLVTTTTTTRAPRKVRMCHKGRSIMVDENAVADHLAHGDTLGPCP